MGMAGVKDRDQDGVRVGARMDPPGAANMEPKAPSWGLAMGRTGSVSRIGAAAPEACVEQAAANASARKIFFILMIL